MSREIPNQAVNPHPAQNASSDTTRLATTRPKTVAIIGGGIAGLSTAHRLAGVAPEIRVALFEASGRLGGVLGTESRDGYLIERAADMFVTQPPWAADLCDQVGLGGELITTDDRYRQAFVVRRGKLISVPSGFALLQPARLWPLVKSPILSWQGKLRLACEYFLPRRRRTAGSSYDESLASFARRRLGREAYQRLVQPLVGGIYTADPERLSLAATLPRFLEMETEYRSLIRAAWQERKSHARMKSRAADESASGARYGMFVAPRRGMASFIEALAGTMPRVEVRLNTPVERLDRTAEGRWRVTFAGMTPGIADFDAIVVASSAHVAAELLAAADSGLAEELRAIQYASTAVVCLGYRRSQIEHPLDGFGCVVPAVEKREILAASFASVKFPDRAPADRVLIRVFIGGALQPELLSRDDEELAQAARRELSELIGARGEPEVTAVTRWTRAMPQYHLGHLDRIARIAAAAANLPGLHLVGSAYRGVGIPHCIQGGRQTAERVAASTRQK
jgi:oxygen-dependent protoporphyrinogen oxidase